MLFIVVLNIIPILMTSYLKDGLKSFGIEPIKRDSFCLLVKERGYGQSQTYVPLHYFRCVLDTNSQYSNLSCVWHTFLVNSMLL